MKTKEKIIKFMELKQAKIHSIYPIKEKKHINFFTDEDKASIEKWTDKKAKEVWEGLKTNLKEITYKYMGLISEMCPYCIYHAMDCENCSYAKNHGECCDEDDALCERIFDDIFKITGENHAHLLSKEFYNSIINKAQTIKSN